MGTSRQAARAVVVSASRAGEWWAVDVAAIDMLPRAKWHMELEVRPDGGAAYRVRGSWKVPKALGGLRRVFSRWSLVPGLELPVLVHPRRPQDVDIDWHAFVREGGMDRAEAATEERRAAESSAAAAQMIRRQPALQARMRATALQHGPSMARQVPAGVRPPEEFRRWLSDHLAAGAISPEEAAALEREAGLA